MRAARSQVKPASFRTPSPLRQRASLVLDVSFWRTELRRDPNDIRNASIVYNCFTAGTCPAVPCPASQWSFFSEVTIPGSFFLP